MKLWPQTLSLRLALMFALVGVLLLGALGFYLYQSLQREIAWRDDQALLGRLQRMQALLDDAASIEALRRRDTTAVAERLGHHIESARRRVLGLPRPTLPWSSHHPTTP